MFYRLHFRSLTCGGPAGRSLIFAILCSSTQSFAIISLHSVRFISLHFALLYSLHFRSLDYATFPLFLFVYLQNLRFLVRTEIEFSQIIKRWLCTEKKTNTSLSSASAANASFGHLLQQILIVKSFNEQMK